MPDFFMNFVVNAGPFTNIIVGAILWFIFRAISANTTAISTQSDAMVKMSTAMDKLGTALLEVSRNVERNGDGQSELIRMMSIFQTAESERHHSNVNTLQLILGAVTSHGRARP